MEVKEERKRGEEKREERGKSAGSGVAVEKKRVPVVT